MGRRHHRLLGRLISYPRNDRRASAPRTRSPFSLHFSKVEIRCQSISTKGHVPFLEAAAQRSGRCRRWRGRAGKSPALTALSNLCAQAVHARTEQAPRFWPRPRQLPRPALSELQDGGADSGRRARRASGSRPESRDRPSRSSPRHHAGCATTTPTRFVEATRCSLER